MVIIYTNENNPATLKLLIGKNIAKVNTDIKVVNIYDRSIPQPKHLPCLELKDQVFFIPNAALCYFFPPTEENSSKVYDWLEWEANILLPCLSIQQGSSVKNINVRKNLESALQMLNETLEGRNYLIENTITSADIAIWCTLYPLQQDDQCSKEYLNSLINISNWLSHLEKEPSFKDALSNYKIDPAVAYSSILIGSKLITSERFDKKGHEKHNVSSKDSPQHVVEAITAEELEAAQKAWKKSIAHLPKLKETAKNVLPIPGEKNVFVTSALPYVNNVPHLGNIIGCVLSADVYARFSRLCNFNTLFICGTDEYGTATETKALEEGLTCQAICDKYFKIHSEIYKWFNISFDHFGRTSNPEQTELCHDLFLQLNANGFMFTQSVEQLHCDKCDRYLADRFVEGGCPNIGCNYEDARGDQCDGCGKLVNAVELKNPRCKICSNTPKLKTSTQFFIDLPKLEPLLHHWMKIYSPNWSHNAQVIAKSWLKEGLKPRCITRDLKWGVPVPLDGYRDKVFYVWFDAPIGYMSISKAYSKDFTQWWLPRKGTNINLYQFMAKDNVPFHSVLFPAMLLGANRGYVTNTCIMATEYLNYEDGKFSKSRGVGVFGNDAQDTGIPSDVWRFYLLYIRPESQDSSFSWNDLVTKNNSELLNNLGNFINRALVFAKNNFNKTVPPMELTSEDYTLLAFCNREYKAYVAALMKAKLRDGIRHILAISRHGNQYMQVNQPWVLLKGSDQERLRAGTVIGVCCNLSCLLATLLSPYLPETSASLKKQLNSSDMVITPSNPEIVTLLPAGHKLGEPSPLFAKIETSQIEILKKRFAGPQNGRETRALTDDFKVIEAKVTEQADKVRALKSSGAAKTLWQPEVAILLDLKKQLEHAQKASQEIPAHTPLQNGKASPEEIKSLEDEVAKQGSIVRKLKEAGALKTEWQPEVDKLLVLKNQLAGLSGVSIIENQKKTKKVKSKA